MMFTDRDRAFFFIAALTIGLPACGAPSGSTDPRADVVASDVSVVFDAGPLACGGMTCGANQVCYQRCSGIDAGHPIEPVCVDVPDSCGGVPSCECVAYDECPTGAPAGSPSGLPFCVQRAPRDFSCQGCA